MRCLPTAAKLAHRIGPVGAASTSTRTSQTRRTQRSGVGSRQCQGARSRCFRTTLAGRATVIVPVFVAEKLPAETTTRHA